MTGATPSRRVPMQVSLVFLCGLALGSVAWGTVFPRPFLFAFGLAAALRIGLAHNGARLLPRRVLQALGVTVTALSVGYLLHAISRTAGERATSGGPDPLLSLMCVVALYQALCLLCRQTTFTWFLLILLSSVHASGAAIESAGPFGLVFVPAYVVLLGWTLLHFERRISLDRATDGDGAVLRLRARAAREVPVRSVLATLALLVVLGFPLGVAAYLAAPRGISGWHLDRDLDEPEAREGGDSERAASGGERTRPGVVRTGPDGGKGLPFGEITEIKKDLTAWIEVWVEGSAAAPRDVVLRDRVHDIYLINGDWKASRDVVRRRYVDLDDGRLDEWTPLGHRDDPRRGRTLRMAFHRGGQRRLYLAPEPVRVRILRDGVAVPGYQVAEGANVAYEASFPLQAGDVVEQRAVPPPSRPGALRGRRSDHGVSPSTSYLDVPPACRPALERLAREVVGGETDPWARARLLEAWLQSEDFIYTLRLPRRYDPRNPILDFLLNHRQGNCEWFATSLTLMLRALGHPARHAVGFWGGDPQEERPSVVMRGSHSHAWSEIYLHGAGWVALNPTPPDRTAADAGSVTVETGAQAQATQEEAFSFLGYDHAAWRAFWGRVGRGLDRHLVAPVAFFFSRRAGYAGWVLLVLGLWALARQREHARLRGRVVAPGTRLPPGPYGRALMLLARKGMRRRGHQTARAFARSATARFPRAGPALWTLTVMYERLRFGGGAADRDRRAAQDALDDLRKALRKPSGEGPPA